MATLTPGVLVKLLQAMNSDTKVGGEHRSSVLQVIGIVPVPGGDDLWPARGFYLQLSDSANSTYVSLSEPEADSILSSRPQLGQLVHLDRLRLSPPDPVPRALGLRPIPFSGRSPPPFSGRPEPLAARLSPSGDGFVIHPASSSDPNPPPKLAPFSDEKPAGTRTVFAAKENVPGPAKNNPDGPAPAAKRRFSSPAAAKLAARKSIGEQQRDPSPTAGRAGSRSSSPVPSKCEVPSLAAAREENRRSAREPAIIVPSRYRQPSPVTARRAAASPVGRRSSGSPGRRLSGGVKLSPASGESGGKKKLAAVVAGMAKISDALVGSSRSVRKSWEDPASNLTASSEQKEKPTSKKKIDHQAILRTQVAISRRLSDVGGGQSSNEKGKVTNNTDSSFVLEKANCTVSKIIVHDRKWTDGSIPFDSVSENLARVGKETLQRKNIASAAATEALEEACAAESVIRCLSMFVDICKSSKSAEPLSTIDRFLSLYDDAIKCNTVAESLATSRSNSSSNGAIFVERHKSTCLWVEAALATDLACVSLLRHGENSEVPSVLRARLSKRNSLGTSSKTNAKLVSRGNGFGEMLELARALRQEMEAWFVKFVEETVDMGFRLFVGHSDSNDNGKVAAILSYLKKVNEWLDGVSGKPEEAILLEMIERLKRKIYGFVIGHVGSAFDKSASLSKA